MNKNAFFYHLLKKFSLQKGKGKKKFFCFVWFGSVWFFYTKHYAVMTALADVVFYLFGENQ